MSSQFPRCLALFAGLCVTFAIGCRKQVEFEISMMSRRAVMLENAVLASDVGRQLDFGYLAKDADKNYHGGWRIYPHETLTVSWQESGSKHSATIKLAATNVGPNGIQIEIKADGTLDTRPK